MPACILHLFKHCGYSVRAIRPGHPSGPSVVLCIWPLNHRPVPSDGAALSRAHVDAEGAYPGCLLPRGAAWAGSCPSCRLETNAQCPSVVVSEPNVSANAETRCRLVSRGRISSRAIEPRLALRPGLSLTVSQPGCRAPADSRRPDTPPSAVIMKPTHSDGTYLPILRRLSRGARMLAQFDSDSESRRKFCPTSGR